MSPGHLQPPQNTREMAKVGKSAIYFGKKFEHTSSCHNFSGCSIAQENQLSGETELGFSLLQGYVQTVTKLLFDWKSHNSPESLMDSFPLSLSQGFFLSELFYNVPSFTTHQTLIPLRQLPKGPTRNRRRPPRAFTTCSGRFKFTETEANHTPIMVIGSRALRIQRHEEYFKKFIH